MLTGWIGLKPSGLKRSQTFFVFLSRLYKNSFFSLNSTLWSFFLCGLTLYSILNNDQEKPLVEKIHVFSINLTAPIFLFKSYIQDFSHHIQENFRTHKFLRSEIEKLKGEIEDLKLIRAKSDYLERENNYLKQILSVTSDVTNQQKRFKVLGVPLNRFCSTMIIAGSDQHHLYKNQAVLTSEGIIGRIQQVGHMVSRVMLVTDINSRIPVRSEQTGEQAILAGQNNDELIILHSNRQVDSNNRNIQVGDKLLTSGYGGIFPPDIPVAIVTSITNNLIKAKMIVAPQKTRYVGVVDWHIPPLNNQ